MTSLVFHGLQVLLFQQLLTNIVTCAHRQLHICALVAESALRQHLQQSIKHLTTELLRLQQSVQA